MELLNRRIIGEPINWLLVTMVLIFVSFACFTVAQRSVDLTMTTKTP